MDGLLNMWLGLVEGMRYIARPIRKNRMSSLIYVLPQMFCLLCGACTRAGIDLEETIWEFFPFVCPTCWKAPCICGLSKLSGKVPKQKSASELAKYRKQNADRRPRTLDGCVEMFAKIYSNHPDSSNFVNIYVHFSEEVAEVAQRIRELNVAEGKRKRGTARLERELRSEIADVFSWLCKLCWRIDLEWKGFFPWAHEHLRTTVSVNRSIRFSSITEWRYRHGCPGCRRRRCSGACGPWGNMNGDPRSL